jgi:hypothetical protein
MLSSFAPSRLLIAALSLSIVHFYLGLAMITK